MTLIICISRDNITSQNLMKLVNDMAENASKNSYIMRALETLQNGNYPVFQAKLEEEGAVVIPNAVTLAFVLEKMVSTMKNNWRFVKVCNEIWAEHDNLKKIVDLTLTTTQGNLFSLAKALSIEQMWKRRLLALETHHLREVSLSQVYYNITFIFFRHQG